jgi:cytochrome d ubiquinol oxidase subunit II
MLVGLAAYAVLAGADFGAGFWELAGGRSEHARDQRDLAHHAMGPVWEANHVWLIFVLVVCWTAYPVAFGSITSTLAVPLFIAGIGIILRGTAYALRSGTTTAREQRRVEVAVAGSSILTPFALGTVVGGIASGRVPVGNAAGNLVTSWLNPTSIMLGVLAVATAAYLAAVYLAADAVRVGRGDLERDFRARALGTAVVAGGAALAGLVVLRFDARPIWDGLTSGAGLAAVVVSAIGGIGTIFFVLRRRYEPARVTAAVAVAAIVAGWGLAQRPQFLPGLTIDQAAAGRSTLVSLLVSLALGAVVLVPSLAFLFTLVLRGRFDESAEPPAAEPEPGSARASRRLLPVAAVCLVAGAAVTALVDSAWGRVVGIPLLFASIVLAFLAIAPALSAVAAHEDDLP